MSDIIAERTLSHLKDGKQFGPSWSMPINAPLSPAVTSSITSSVNEETSYSEISDDVNHRLAHVNQES